MIIDKENMETQLTEEYLKNELEQDMFVRILRENKDLKEGDIYNIGNEFMELPLVSKEMYIYKKFTEAQNKQYYLNNIKKS